MKTILLSILGTMLTADVFLTPVRAQPVSCVLGALTLPILGGPGDAPILPAAMQGKPVAFYYSTTVDGFYGGDIMPYGGSDTGKRSTITLDGSKIDDAPLMRTGQLKLGDLNLGTPSLIRLPQFSFRYINQRPVIGVIGAHQFEHLAVLMDLPHGVFALMRFRNDKACDNAAAAFLGPGETAFPLDAEHRAEIPLNRVKRSLALDPNTPVNILPAIWVATSDGRAVTGYRPSDRRRDTPALKDGTLPLSVPPGIAGTDFHLQGSPGASGQGTASGILGLAFFEHNVILFDYPNHTVHFLPSRHQRLGKRDRCAFLILLKMTDRTLLSDPLQGHGRSHPSTQVEEPRPA